MDAQTRDAGPAALQLVVAGAGHNAAAAAAVGGGVEVDSRVHGNLLAVHDAVERNKRGGGHAMGVAATGRDPAAVGARLAGATVASRWRRMKQTLRKLA